MHCYVINMPSCRERLKRTSLELERTCPDIPWSIPPMYIADEMGNESFSRLYDSKNARVLRGVDLSHGEIACALSHQSALKEFLQTSEMCALIVEDDVKLSLYAGEFLKCTEKWLSVRMNKQLCIVLSQASAVRYWTSRKWIGDIRMTRPVAVSGAIAYVVNREGAKKILTANHEPIRTTSDDWRFYVKHGLTVYGVDKPLAGSYDYSREDSSLQQGREEIYKQSMALRHFTLLQSVAKVLSGRARGFWWRISGVTIEAKRTNERIYLSGGNEKN